MGFDQTRAELHVGYKTGRTANYRQRGTGLGTPGLINGRPATDDEQAVQARVYQRSRDATAEQLRIQPWSATRAEQWAGIDRALAALRASGAMS